MRISSAIGLATALLRGAAAYSTLSDAALLALPEPGTDFDIHKGALLAPILRPRVPGTPGSLAVLQHFVDFFNRNLPEWTLSFQNSSQTTPTSNGKEIPFVNLIATRDPPWAHGQGDVGRLTLVAHYDSKLTPEGFIGATDSAAPCAMLLYAARTIDEALTKKWSAMAAAGNDLDDELEGHKGVQILLLDGEEAFVTWTSQDSLYGARSLAEEWEKSSFGAWSSHETALGAIDLFVLLDLLGGEKPKVPSYFKTTHWAYKHMADIEARLRSLKKFKSLSSPPFLYEADKSDAALWIGGHIEDDHIPFMARGVSVLHMIPSPFPHVWHTINDDGEHLDMDSVHDWAVLTAAFAAEWMELDPYIRVDAKSKPTQAVERAIEEKTEFLSDDAIYQL